jgi:hypothetical protein
MPFWGVGCDGIEKSTGRNDRNGEQRQWRVVYHVGIDGNLSALGSKAVEHDVLQRHQGLHLYPMFSQLNPFRARYAW